MIFLKKKKNMKTSAMAQKLITISDAQSIVSEQFRTIRTNINFSLPNQNVKSILVTSSIPGEGKSTNAANLAIVYAQAGKRVLIIDGDMRKPTIHHTFFLVNTIGLSSYLSKQKELYDIIQETSVEGLYIISSGPIPPNPAELLASTKLDILLMEVAKDFDIIIIDAPPLLSVTDAQILSNKCDGTLLVVNAGVTEKENVLKAKSYLIVSNANILGVVLNNCELQREHYYYQ